MNHDLQVIDTALLPRRLPQFAANEPHVVRGLVVTSRGIVIGGAWVPPPAQMSPDAEAIQAALLQPRRVGRRPRDEHEVVALLALLIGAVTFTLLLIG